MSASVELTWNGDMVSRDIAKKIDIAILQAAILGARQSQGTSKSRHRKP
jgi:hypothetical protein